MYTYACSAEPHDHTWHDDHKLTTLSEAIEAELQAEIDEFPVTLLLRGSSEARGGRLARCKPCKSIRTPQPLSCNSPSHGRRKPPFIGRIAICIAGGSLIPWMFYALYVLTLETSNGQLRIESEVEGIRIQLKKDGAIAKNMEVTTGTKATRVSADKYDIEIESASDYISMDQDIAIISSNDKVVAKISQVAKANTNARARTLDVGEQQSKSMGEPLYEGRTLSQWLDIFRREKNHKFWAESLDAISVLTSNEQKAELLEEIFQTCYANRSLGKIATWGLNPLWVELFVEQLRKTDPTERKNRVALIPLTVSGPELDPIWKWIEEQEVKGDDKTSILVAFMLPRNEFLQNRFNSFIYVEQHFPKVGERLASILIAAPGCQRATNSGGWGITEDSMAKLSQIALNRLIDPTTTFENRFRSHRFILESGRLRSFDLSQRNQFASQSNRLISEAYEHRFDRLHAPEGTPTFSSGTDIPMFFHDQQNDKSESLIVASLVQSIFNHRLDQGFEQNAAYFDAVAKLESACSSDAMAACEELPKGLSNRPWSSIQLDTDTFLPHKAVFDFVAVPLEASSTNAAYQLAVSFALHRYACCLLFAQQTPQLVIASAPEALIHEIDEFMVLDSNHDWRLTAEEDGWEGTQNVTLSNFRSAKGGVVNQQQGQVNRFAPAQGGRKPNVDPALLKWAEAKLKRLDKDGDGFLTLGEFKDGDFDKVDRNHDGRIDGSEYAISRSVK